MENDSFITHQENLLQKLQISPSCLESRVRSLKNLPNFYKKMITNWAICLSYSPFLPSAILSRFLWFNLDIKIDNKNIFISGFASKNINFVGQIFHENGKTNSWDYIKSEFNLESKLKYRWIQLTDVLPKLWNDRILNCIRNSVNPCILDHYLIKKNNSYCFNKLESRELHQIQISGKYKKKATWQLYYERYFNKFDFDWKSIWYLLKWGTS